MPNAAWLQVLSKLGDKTRGPDSDEPAFWVLLAESGPNNPVELTAHTMGFFPSQHLCVWAAAHRGR